MDRMLTTEEAARRLGVKVPTLYAYVSRGLLESHPRPEPGGGASSTSTTSRRWRRAAGAGARRRPAWPPITTAVTQLDQQLGPIYRGRPATELAADSQLRGGGRAPLADRRRAGLVARPTSGRARSTHTLDRMRWALVLCGATDPCGPTCARPRSPAPPAAPPPPWPTSVGPAPPGEDPDASIAARLAARLAASAHGGAGRRRQRRPRPPGRPRARHLDHGRARGGVGALRSLRRVAGRAGHPGRARCTAAPASRPTSCSSWPSATACRAPSTTCCGEQGRLPGFGHAVYKSGDAALRRAAGAGRAAR